MQKDPETYAIIGAAMEVHRVLGHGFLEAVYQEALEYELNERKISFKREVSLDIRYKEVVLGKKYVADFIVFDHVVVEIKAASQLTSADEGQLINYLKATGIQKGLLLNFGSGSLEYKRMVF